MSFPCLRQRRLCLGQPEGHLHGPVQLDGRAQGSPGLLCSSHLAIQHAEPTVAVGCKGTHAQCLGQGERLLVVRFSLLSLRRLSLRCNLAKEPQGVGFVTPFLMGPGELQGPLRLGARLVQPASRRYASPSQTPRRASLMKCIATACSTACSSSGRASAVRPASV